MPLPSSTSQTVRRSAFGCCDEAVISATITLSIFEPRSSISSISTPASVSKSASLSISVGRSTNSRSQLTENFIVEDRRLACPGRQASSLSTKQAGSPLAESGWKPDFQRRMSQSCELLEKPQIVLGEETKIGNVEQNH